MFPEGRRRYTKKIKFSVPLMFLKEIAFFVPRRPAEVHKKNEISVSLMFLKEIAFFVHRRPAEVHKKNMDLQFH